MDSAILTRLEIAESAVVIHRHPLDVFELFSDAGSKISTPPRKTISDKIKV